MNGVKTKKCSSCGTPFTCGNVDENHTCWCNSYPPLFTPNKVVDCLCPICLKAASAEKIDAYVASLTPEEALCNKAKELPKTSQLIEGLDYYVEDGKFVFKSWYHLKRGSCCESDCRHCPYGYKNNTL